MVFPVVDPGFFADWGRAPCPADVNVHDQMTHWWSAIRAVIASTPFNPEQGRIYGQTALCLDAATRGVGIAMWMKFRRAYFLHSNASKSLFNHRLPSADAYYFILDQRRLKSGEVSVFKH
ncbi:MAG: hypothetical protein R8G34_08965 [Paracoccaceae bacterium]|nr:hypothetical protein [Paracoccaceae bacterium]